MILRYFITAVLTFYLLHKLIQNETFLLVETVIFKNMLVPFKILQSAVRLNVI